jgi:capsid assembly protease
MLHAFNTPLLVEPSKAMAFLSGLGPRILGRQIEAAGVAGGDGVPEMVPTPSRRASLLTGDLLDGGSGRGEAPYPVVDGIAVIEISGVLIHRGSWIGQSSGQTSYEGIAAQIAAAADDPTVRGVALEIDSFGGEVAGVFDLADRIRATRAVKPVWAFVAEHAFSAGYALASQADRILLPRTGAVGSIGVVVMHADHSGQLDQNGVRVTLIHSGRHKVDGNPYTPLPAMVRDDIQREIDVLRFLFTETVAAGRGGRLNQDAAMATEAATYRGTDGVATGLADEVTDLAGGFAAFRQLVARGSTLSPVRLPRAVSPPRVPRASLSHPRQEACMATEQDQDDSPDEPGSDATDAESGEPDAAENDLVPQPNPSEAVAAVSPPALAPAEAAAPSVAAAQPGNLATLSAQQREAAAEIAEIAAQAGRLGIAIDAAKALRDGTTPEALRRLVLDRASAAADARDIVATAPSPVMPQTKESPIVAAAKRAAADGKRG